MKQSSYILFLIFWISRCGSAYNFAITREIKTNGLAKRSLTSSITGTTSDKMVKYFRHHHFRNVRNRSLLSASNQLQSIEVSNDELREDIETMKKTAKERLKKLDEQMNGLQKINHYHEQQQEQQKEQQQKPSSSSLPSQHSSSVTHKAKVSPSNGAKSKIEKVSSFSSTSSSSAAMIIDSSGTTSTTKGIVNSNKNKQEDYLTSTLSSIFGFVNDGDSNNKNGASTATPDSKDQVILQDPHVQASDRALDNTRWKIVFKIEKDDTCKKVLERPLMVHTVFDFTSEPIPQNSDQDDDFLYWSGTPDPKVSGSTSAVISKKIRVHEAYVGPTSLSVGQKQINNINPLGGWRVVHGNGPKEKDILRFYFDIDAEQNESIDESPSLLAPGRYYATCGYFSMENHKDTEKNKDELRNKLNNLKIKRDQLHQGNNNNNDQSQLLNPNLIFKNIMKNVNIVELIKKDHKLKELDKEIYDVAKTLIVACNRDPCKSIMRLSRKGDVGLGKGQICKQVKSKGNLPLASKNYQVMGKMELASIDYHKTSMPSTIDK